MIKKTAQSKFIYDYIKNTKTHPSAEEIYHEARKHLPYITRATVYNVIKRLMAKGEIRELNIKKGVSVFDGNPEPHAHLKCRVCGRIEDIELPGFSALLEEIKKQYPESNVDLTITAVCSRCLHNKGGEDNGN